MRELEDDGNRELTEKLEIIPPDKSDTPTEEKIKRAMMEDDFLSAIIDYEISSH